MGSSESEEGHWFAESPVHKVRVRAFLMCRTECTQRAWVQVGGEDGRNWWVPDLPIEGVTWDAVKAWCGKAGLGLPSEAEWEFACRAGTTMPFSFGQAIAPAQVNYDGNYPYGNTPKGEYREKTVACGSLPGNPWGLFEVHGNISEWCEDDWHSSYERAPTDGSAWKTEGAPFRVFRSGIWRGIARYCRSAARWGVPGDRGAGLGFRPAFSLP
ncbi:MAG: SUMF1/EgtB/PvdO family nonheme iron enzyme [Candidatus Eisenbacteria bacterium]|nr:SUMF1/EgtB/PvdO family nonheme iron enzyme [Candidatus Eisenbacteria bacterium]